MGSAPKLPIPPRPPLPTPAAVAVVMSPDLLIQALMGKVVIMPVLVCVTSTCRQGKQQMLVRMTFKATGR